MDGDESRQRHGGRKDHEWTNRRSWTIRRTAHVNYERFSALNAGGEARIFFSFRLPEGDVKLNEDVYRIIEEHKRRPDGYPTGLRFSHDRIHGKAFSLADNEAGRIVADRLDRQLAALSEKLDCGESRGR